MYAEINHFELFEKKATTVIIYKKERTNKEIKKNYCTHFKFETLAHLNA
jgi:hypothetical protein